MFVVLISIFSFEYTVALSDTINDEENKKMTGNRVEYESAYFGGGCFWCMEAVFENVEGVIDVVSGFAGGKKENPTYKEVCTGTTGHAEVVMIKYDPSIVTYEELLKIFWKSHNPTQINRQGADVGSQYRSIILYTDDKQKMIAEQSRHELEESGVYRGPIVTEIVPFIKFYPAEDYHQDYYRKNPNAPYCTLVIQPKLEKLGFR